MITKSIPPTIQSTPGVRSTLSFLFSARRKIGCAINPNSLEKYSLLLEPTATNLSEMQNTAFKAGEPFPPGINAFDGHVVPNGLKLVVIAARS
jgi:hypothetical protein